uniref:INCENP_ARK-bind domain-containing protein n=1 Tax=Panagrellus redivivus TaxID=6233 RepID=A0A7E4ULH9_PANRE
MLGAQALRTKQKAEQKEREKRQKEKQRNLELQRERIQKAASEDAAATTAEAHLLYPNSHLHQHPGIKHKQRHSVHATAYSSHLIPLPERQELHHHDFNHGSREKIELPQRSPSQDYGKAGEGEKNGASKFMKWLGLASSSSSSNNGVTSKKPQRRMSTY